MLITNGFRYKRSPFMCQFFKAKIQCNFSEGIVNEMVYRDSKAGILSVYAEICPRLVE